MKVAIVIPAYNEVETIGGVVSAVHPFGQPIVVDDGSRDETAAVAAKFGAVVVKTLVNRGYDGALQAGFEKAAAEGADVVVTFDADGQHDPAILDKVLAPIRDNTADLVLGMRPMPARFSERIFNWYAQMRFGVPDILCGLKAYRVELFREHGRFDGVRSIGTELALASLRRGARLAIVPVSIRSRQGSARFGSIWRANMRILRALATIMREDLLGGGRLGAPSRPST